MYVNKKNSVKNRFLISYRRKAEKCQERDTEVSPILLIPSNITEHIMTKYGKNKHGEDKDEHDIDERLLCCVDQSNQNNLKEICLLSW